MHVIPVASLRLVSPVAATDGVTYFSPKELETFLVIALSDSCRLVTTPIFRHHVIQCSL